LLNPSDLDAHNASSGVEQIDGETFTALVAVEVGQRITVRCRADDNCAFEAMNVRKIRRLCLQGEAAHKNQNSEDDPE